MIGQGANIPTMNLEWSADHKLILHMGAPAEFYMLHYILCIILSLWHSMWIIGVKISIKITLISVFFKIRNSNHYNLWTDLDTESVKCSLESD